MLNTIDYILFPNRFESRGDHCPMPILDQAGHFLGSQLPKFLFDLCEDKFYRIIVGAIGRIIDVPALVFSHASLRFLANVR